MSPPCTLREDGDDAGWTVTNKAGEQLIITMEEIHHDSSHDLGIDPGLKKDGVEAHLQELLADRIETLGTGWTLIRREYPTAIGPVDILCRDADRRDRRRGDQAARRDRRRRAAHPLPGPAQPRPAPRPVRGVFAAQEIKPQARVLATDRGIGCVTLDYDALRGIEDDRLKLF